MLIFTSLSSESFYTTQYVQDLSVWAFNNLFRSKWVTIFFRLIRSGVNAAFEKL